MPISISPPPRTKPTEADIEATINRGGAVAPQPPMKDADAPKHINTRLTVGLIDQINVLRKKRPRKPGSPKLGISLQDWILEAVLEKLKREGK